MVHQLGGNVNPSNKKEFGHSELNISDIKHDLFNDIDLKVEYTFGYKLINEKMKIILHHSSLPYNR